MVNSGVDTALMSGDGIAAVVEPAQFRALMSTFPTGVAVVTTTEPEGRPWGMTCSTVCSVSVDPPTLLVCLREESPTLQAMLKLSTFAVNLLHEGARDTAQLFASGAPDRFERIRWRNEPSFGGPHLVDMAHAVADCQIVRTVCVGDHIVVFGEVLGLARHDEVTSPLLYGFRQYSSWSAGTP
ncbi:flavin reductase family protein [Actinophytocola sp.]|uniref:flavin reductase family protein n=1 Tax=Actinophytocola sp. TaxID=1872138 RepID=UPI002D547605|nr:flavin reductase family protein [Actinophytocola sp.]HYQ62598.1 flavin reductase family protein [Actinophytocola sp.]